MNEDMKFLILFSILLYLAICWWVFYGRAEVKLPVIQRIASDELKAKMKFHGIQAAFEDEKGWYFVRQNRRVSL